MATRITKVKAVKVKPEEVVAPLAAKAAETVKFAEPSWHREGVDNRKSKVEVRAEEEEEGKLDPQEEKVLDWILKAVVAFILGWLLLSILMVIGGYFGIWK